MENRMDELKDVPEASEVVMISLVMGKDGSLKISGMAIADRSLAYGLLETAKDMIREMHTPKIIKQSGGLLNHLRNGKF